MKQLNILVIPGYKLFPMEGGGAHAQLPFLAKQQEQHFIDLLVTPQNIAPEYIDEFKIKYPNFRLIPVGYKKNSGIKKITIFLSKQFRKISGRDYSYNLKKIKYFNGLIIKDASFIEHVQAISFQKKYDVIQIEHSINMGLVEILPADAVKIFVHHEIAHTRIFSDMLSLSYNEAYATYISATAQAMEISWLNKYNGVIVLCNEDRELLRQKGVIAALQVARPFALFDDELVKQYNPQIFPQLVFAGHESHFPNKEGLTWFLREVYPLLKKIRDDIKLKITGNWTEDFRTLFVADKNIQFTGFVDDFGSVLLNAIMIVPIRIGSGIRIKIITAFAKGAPVVSTGLGASGIPGIIDGENIILADSAVSFAEGIIRLFDDSLLREKISNQSFHLAKSEYGNALFVEERNSFYYELTGSPKVD